MLTSHAGSLPRPDDLLTLHRETTSRGAADNTVLEARLTSAVAEAVRQQVAAGLDVVNDGEFGKPMRAALDAGAWGHYIYDRLTGFGPAPAGQGVPTRAPAGGARRLVSVFREHRDFAAFYETLLPGSTTNPPRRPACIGPIAYCGHAALQADLDNLRAAMRGVAAAEAFVTSIAVGSVEVFSRGQNVHYATTEAYLEALATAMREEYRAIVNAGFVLQLDDPGLPDAWAMLDPPPTRAEYRRYAQLRVDALNYALEGLPEERVRYHMCWGSWHGPHVTDLPLRDIVEVMLRVKAQAYAIEAANARHAHEWKVWHDIALPEGKVLIPGVVSHATNVVEHPELVADRIVTYANVVGREQVIAGTDCGLGGRGHPQIAWAKLQSLAEGAARATQQLWTSSR